MEKEIMNATADEMEKKRRRVYERLNREAQPDLGTASRDKGIKRGDLVFDDDVDVCGRIAVKKWWMSRRRWLLECQQDLLDHINVSTAANGELIARLQHVIELQSKAISELERQVVEIGAAFDRMAKVYLPEEGGDGAPEVFMYIDNEIDGAKSLVEKGRELGQTDDVLRESLIKVGFSDEQIDLIMGGDEE
jgi:hypothetical protein